jgi:proton-coupled amino acid transporter
MVRKISTFAKFHVFGDAMIFITLFVIVVFASISVSNNGWLDSNPSIPWFNKKLWPDSIGFAIYAFEGIGVILPVQDITEDKEGYFKIICITCGFITLMYVTFSEFCLFAYYDRFNPDGPLITDYLPPDNRFCWAIKILFCFNLIVSYTLVIYPANMVVDGWLYSDWPKTKKRQMFKNGTRALLILFTIILALCVYNKLPEFLSIVGSLTCTPIAFILPALFHYKACATTVR